MNYKTISETFDYVIIGSGFGGSTSAMRLAEKGYRVLVLEKGKRYQDQDFAKSNWNIPKYLWMPGLRCFGIFEINLFKNVMALRGSGVGGGSLGYANVLMEPEPHLFNTPAWKQYVDWPQILPEFYALARKMLGVVPCPQLRASDEVIKSIASDMGCGSTFRNAEIGVFFGEPGQEGIEVDDPFFEGEGPSRSGCTHCGGCMIGCRHNAKNTLLKNYLYFAEKLGAQIMAESEARDIRPLSNTQPDGAQFEVLVRRSTGWLTKPTQYIRARNVIVSAGTIGSLELLFRCRDVTRSLPRISQQLGNHVGTNSEALVGIVARSRQTDYSVGVSIASIFRPDDVTSVEPVRYPAGSSLMRLLCWPLTGSGSFLTRFGRALRQFITHPLDYMKLYFLPGWAQRTTFLLMMQAEDNAVRMRLGRSIFTLFTKKLISKPGLSNPAPIHHLVRDKVTSEFAEKINGFPFGSMSEDIFNIPVTAHILGGCQFGKTDKDGVIDLNCQVHNYPGLFIVDGSVIPANPGMNPSLTITAFAEYAMSKIPKI
jgi:cholesterol oxidase